MTHVVLVRTLFAIAAGFALTAQVPDSSFNTYSVHLKPLSMQGACAGDRFPDFSNYTYRFRSGAPLFGSGVVSLRDGRFTQRAGGVVDWEVTLMQRHPIDLEGDPAIALLFFANHLAGTGSATELLIVRCHNRRPEVVFEASGEGIYPADEKGYSYPGRGRLRVTHAVWTAADAHCCPSALVNEQYYWDAARNRFRLIDTLRQPQNPPGASAATAKGASVPMHATGTFDVKVAPDAAAAVSTLGRMSIDKQFHGDLEGTSKGEMLTAGTSVKGSAAYVAIERVTGTLAGRSGTFTLQHSGTMTRGAQQLTITVVPDSGTDRLAGISGRMTIRIEDGKHFYDFEYSIAEDR